MNDKQAYKKLKEERPVIVRLMEQLAPEHKHPEYLAKKVTNKGDPAELVALIKQSAAYILKRQP